MSAGTWLRTSLSVHRCLVRGHKSSALMWRRTKSSPLKTRLFFRFSPSFKVLGGHPFISMYYVKNMHEVRRLLTGKLY